MVATIGQPKWATTCERWMSSRSGAKREIYISTEVARKGIPDAIKQRTFKMAGTMGSSFGHVMDAFRGDDHTDTLTTS